MNLQESIWHKSCESRVGDEDTRSMVDLSPNKKFIANIWSVDKGSIIHCNAGRKEAKQKATIIIYEDVCF